MGKKFSAITAIFILIFWASAVYAQSNDVIIYGTTLPFKKVVISTKVPGTIDFLPEIEGTKVKSGEVILMINKKDFELSANVLKKQVSLSEIATNHASLENKRIEELYKKNATSAQTRDNAEYSKDSAYASLELTKSNLKIAEKSIEDTIQRAPFDGIISKKFLEVGEYVDKGKPVVEIVNIDTLKAQFKVPEKFVNKVKVGDKIKISLEHCPEVTFTGEVYTINPVGDSVNHAFEIIAIIKNADHAIKAGMFIKGVLTLNTTGKPDNKAISQNINETQKKSTN
ncbi:MAG: efflux RND transporter periplasmic adaptor subunit [Candidatus Wallbacteria bacterium]